MTVSPLTVEDRLNRAMNAIALAALVARLMEVPRDPCLSPKLTAAAWTTLSDMCVAAAEDCSVVYGTIGVDAWRKPAPDLEERQ